MKILVVGNGGREHALAWKISQSADVQHIYCAPGNPGTAMLGTNVGIRAEAIDELAEFAAKEAIDMTIVGPEIPLVDGIVDVFDNKGLRIFGPTAAAARLEGSKTFAKQMMAKYDIPTAGYREFSKEQDARTYLEELRDFPVVLKADGLAAGKGVLICTNRDEALEALKLIMSDKAFGTAGNLLVVEEFLEGEETSIFAICDGKEYLLFPASQDHKKIGEGDSGKNTGGMGAYAPAPLVTKELLAEIEKTIIQPTIDAMKQEGHPYKGLLYFGLMIVSGKPYVLEYNCRFGDPETEAVLPLVESDIVPLLAASIDGRLGGHQIQIKDQAAMDVVISSGGYPDHYEKGMEISGLEHVESDVLLFHAGTSIEDGKLITAGGRVLNVVALGSNLNEARDRVYKAVDKLHFDKMYYRTDIGFRAL